MHATDLHPAPGSTAPPPWFAPGAPAARLPSWLARDTTLFAGALVLRAALTVLVFQERGVRGGLELGTLADSIVAGKGFVWHFYGSDVPRTSFFPPFYPYLLAFLKLVLGGGWVVGIQALQVAVSAIVPLVVRRLADRLLRADLAWSAAYAAALWPPFVAYASEIFPVTFHTLAVPALLLLMIEAAGRRRGWRGVVEAGLGYGITAYSMPSFLGSLLIMPAGLKASGSPWRRALLVPAVTLGLALVVIMPWSLRNLAVHGRFVPVATNLGFNLVGANNPFARPYTNVLCAHDEIRWQVIDRQRLEHDNEAAFDRALMTQAIAYMVANPIATVRAMATRIGYYWWISPVMVRYDRLRGLVGMALMSVVLPLFIIGVATSWRHRRRLPFGVVYAACVWMTLFYMNFAVRGRYSLAIHPVMLMMAVLGAAQVWRFSPWGRRRPRLPGAHEDR